MSISVLNRRCATIALALALYPCPHAGAAESSTALSDWVDRFSFHPPSAATEGLGAPCSAALPAFVVTPAQPGRQLVRVSLPFAPGSFPVEAGLDVIVGAKSENPDIQVLTCHPGRPACVRRAMVTFVHAFADERPVTFQTVLKPEPAGRTAATSQPGPAEAQIGALTLRLSPAGVEILREGETLWRAELIAPPLQSPVAPITEVIARGRHYLWVRLLVPDERWPRILEIRADALGTVALRGHLQRLESTPDVVAYAPELGWRIDGPAAVSSRAGAVDQPIDAAGWEHAFDQGVPACISTASQRVDFPDADSFRRGTLSVKNRGPRCEMVYGRCRPDEQLPQQYAAWRTATVVVSPMANPPWSLRLEPPHQVRVAAEAFDRLYHCGSSPDLSPWPALAAAARFHIDAMASSTLLGDDFGNVTQMPQSAVYGMNRLNHCPAIFESYYRSGDARLRGVALDWCDNYHDLSIWWGTTGTTRFGGTRYNNISAHGERPPDPKYMWRSNTSVSFCTKGCDTFFYAYEETGDPRMATALRWQVDYAAHEVHANTGECRNIGDVMDWMRLYRFTGETRYLDAGMRLFRELRTKLSEGDLFSQGGQPIEKDPPFIEEDKLGLAHPFAKPYILGYALAGLPTLAGLCPDEPKLRDVIRAVADFQAAAQDPTGGWRYPHPNSSHVNLSQSIEHAMQLSRGAAFLENRGEDIAPLLDAIERTLQLRILPLLKSGRMLGGLGSWEEAAGLLKDGKTIYDLYRKPKDRDPSRDYTEGRPGLGGAAPDGVVYFSEVLDFYLAHRPAERLFNANPALGKVLERIPASQPAGARAVPSSAPATYGVADQLPVFREALLNRLTFPLAWNPASDAGFPEWRRQARAKVLECLLTPPPRTDFAPVVVAREDRGSYEAQRLVFNVSADCRVPAYLLVPKGAGPFPAVIALHDHGAFFLIGKEKMIRPFDARPEIVEAARTWVGKSYGGRFVGDALAERGYVVFSMDALYWGDRGRREGVDHAQQQALASNLMLMGTTWLGTITWDDVRSAEFVASLPHVDPQRIGAIGLSMGCHRTWMLHALSDRITAAAGVCWMCTTDALMTPGNNQTKGQSAYSMLAPNLRNFIDYSDVAAIACPKPLLLFDGGEKDTLFPVRGVDAAYARLRRVWDSQAAGEKLVTRRWDVGHVFDLPMQDTAFAWLDRWLKKPAG